MGDKRQSFSGGTYVSGCIRHQRKLSLCTSAGAWTGFASLAEGACDLLRVDTDNTVVYMQPPGRRRLVAVDADNKWTAGAGWTVASGVATHTASGGTATISQDTSATNADDPLLVNEYYAVVFTISGRTAGTVTPKLGTTAGTARSTDGTYVEILQAQSAVISFTPTTDFDGSIALASVWAIPRTPPIVTGQWEPSSAVKVVCAAASSAPGTITSATVWGGWYMRPGAEELT